MINSQVYIWPVPDWHAGPSARGRWASLKILQKGPLFADKGPLLQE